MAAMPTCRQASRLDLKSTLRQLTWLLGRPLTLREPLPALRPIRTLTSSSNPWTSIGLRPQNPLYSRLTSVGVNVVRRYHIQPTTAVTDESLTVQPSKRPLIPYIPPSPALPDQKHQTLTLYTITPIPEHQLEDLREEIFLRLVPFDITGRIYLAKDGINLHLCTPVEHLTELKSSLEQLVLDRFGRGPDGAIWNLSCDQPGERVFRKLKVAIKRQLVADGRLGAWDIQDSEPPQYLEPEEFHARLDEVGDKALLVDMRNHFENEVGTFKTAVKMDCTTFRQNMDLLDQLLEGRDKSEEVMMVCTGGIRCSISGRYVKQKGFKDVKMLKGGITSYGRYIKSHPDVSSHFVGKNFTFDGRRGERITDHVISSCHQCHTPHDHITNCANTRCHLLFIQCPSCRQKWSNTCGPECHQAVETGSGPGLLKPYDYHAQVRPGSLAVDQPKISKAA